MIDSLEDLEEKKRLRKARIRAELELVKGAFARKLGDLNDEDTRAIWQFLFRYCYITRSTFTPGAPRDDMVYFEGRRSVLMRMLRALQWPLDKLFAFYEEGQKGH